MRTKDLEMFVGDVVVLTIKGEEKIGIINKLNKGSIVFQELPAEFGVDVEVDAKTTQDSYPEAVIDTTLIDKVELFNKSPE